jgi:hypothetical protein
MTIPNRGLPTGRPDMVWNKHPEIKFFYASVSDRYIYFLYRSAVRCWVWEVWTRPSVITCRRLLNSSCMILEGARMQFHTAHSRANEWLNLYEDDPGTYSGFKKDCK